MTRKCLTDEQRGRLWTRFGAIVEKVEKEALPYDGVMGALQLIFDGDIPRPIFKRDMRKEAGWELEKEGPAHPPSITKPDDLELMRFFDHDEQRIFVRIFFDEQNIAGKEIAKRKLDKRAAELAGLGQKTAEWLLECQEEIPEAWRGDYLLFPGTVWQDRKSNCYFPYLVWNGSRWCQGFLLFEYSCHSDIRLVRASKAK